METNKQINTKPKTTTIKENPKSNEQSILELDISRIESQIRQRKYLTKIVTLGGIIVLIAGITILYAASLINPIIPFLRKDTILPTLVYLGTTFATVIIILYLFLESRVQALNSELDLLNTKKRISSQLPQSLNPMAQVSTTYFDSLVRINVENLAEYYSLVKIHTENSFRVSISSGVIGFALILIGLTVGFINNSNNQTMVYISTASGIVIEFISGIFFYQYNRTIIRLKDYHDSLLAVQNVLLSFKIVGEIKDEKEKVKMMAQMLGSLIGKQSLNSASSENERAIP